MLQPEREWARPCHCGLEEMASFMTCNTVTNLRTLDRVHFHRESHSVVSVSPLARLEGTGRDELLLKNTEMGQVVMAHKEARTGRSSIFTSLETITPFWMYLWEQRADDVIH